MTGGATSVLSTPETRASHRLHRRSTTSRATRPSRGPILDYREQCGTSKPSPSGGRSGSYRGCVGGTEKGAGGSARASRGCLQDGTVHMAEIHWYEAHGIGRREMKIKFPLLD
jgi:hypothetical protein